MRSTPAFHTSTPSRGRRSCQRLDRKSRTSCSRMFRDGHTRCSRAPGSKGPKSQCQTRQTASALVRRSRSCPCTGCCNSPSESDHCRQRRRRPRRHPRHHHRSAAAADIERRASNDATNPGRPRGKKRAGMRARGCVREWSGKTKGRQRFCDHSAVTRRPAHALLHYATSMPPRRIPHINTRVLPNARAPHGRIGHAPVGERFFDAPSERAERTKGRSRGWCSSRSPMPRRT